MRITPYNEITSSITITPSTEDTAYLRENLYDTYGTQVFKFTDYTDVDIVFDAGSGNTIDFNSIAIVNHNLTAAATIEIQGNATDSWGGPSFDETITWRTYMTYDFYGSSASYRYARLRIQNAALGEAIQLGYIMLGTYIQMPGFAAGVNISDTTIGTGYISDSGQAGGSKRYFFRSLEVEMGDFSNSQRQVIRTLIQTNSNFQPMAAVLWESDFAKELPMYCVAEASKSFTQGENHYNNWNTSFSLRETL